MATRPFIPKEDHSLPDAYGIKVHFVHGKCEAFEVASHTFNTQTGVLELWTYEDECRWVPMSSVAYLAFDKRFSTVVEVARKGAENDKLAS